VLASSRTLAGGALGLLRANQKNMQEKVKYTEPYGKVAVFV
jgi:hypothetical protein